MLRKTLKFGLDAGTAHFRLCTPDHIIQFKDEKTSSESALFPSVVVMEGAKVVKVGWDAYRAEGRLEQGQTREWAISGGKPCNEDIIKAVLHSMTEQFKLVQRASGVFSAIHRMDKVEFIVATPCIVDEVHYRAFRHIMEEFHSSVLFVPQPWASALFAAEQAKQKSLMIFNLGRGTFDVSLLHHGSFVEGGTFSIPYGSGDIDRSIQGYIKKKYSLLIDERQAEFLKIKSCLGTIFGPRQVKLRGKLQHLHWPEDSEKTATPTVDLLEIQTNCLDPFVEKLAEDLRQAFHERIGSGTAHSDMLNGSTFALGNGFKLGGLADKLGTAIGRRIQELGSKMDGGLADIQGVQLLLNDQEGNLVKRYCSREDSPSIAAFEFREPKVPSESTSKLTAPGRFVTSEGGACPTK
ncbi:MAG: rod shape-determining protein [Candidatus Doudnabacteria bacterium]|nr:rod shape-determining protein [Candidatus Doudnabacteria bacterium]